MPLAAQEASVTKKTDAFTIKTTQTRVAANLTPDDPPELKAGEHYVLTLGDDGEWTCATAAGAVPFLQVHMRPALLMETFAAQVEQARGMVGLMAGMGAVDRRSVRKT